MAHSYASLHKDEIFDPLTVLVIDLLGVHVLDDSGSQVMARCIKQHCSPDNAYDLVVEDRLIAGNTGPRSHSWQSGHPGR